MSVALYSASGNNASLHSTTVGGSKPLHRFIKGQPKIIGVIVLILGSSNVILSISTSIINSPNFHHIWGVIPPGIVIGLLFITTGILFILTEHNPTKKTVTISLALSIVTVLGTCWTALHIIPDLIHSHYRYEYLVDNITEEEEWTSYDEAMERSFEAIFLLYTLMGGIIFTVMSVMAGAALRSTKSQTMIMMTTPTSETQVDQRGQEDGLNCERMSEEK
ncbi:uncharacterized protein LOC132976141 [Labrus mixtus]|uniref:uncharacterized protein LOC132976141 n=1 Tax=Labrus mixtus TaxID=508554 RepID=UPI0029BFDDD5|nr:uncharacterized protein LOC132976141 [Labrus mixtus]